MLPETRPIPFEAIGAAVGCHFSMVQKIEAGDRTPGLKLATRFADLGVADAEDWHKPLAEEEAA